MARTPVDPDAKAPPPTPGPTDQAALPTRLRPTDRARAVDGRPPARPPAGSGPEISAEAPDEDIPGAPVDPAPVPSADAVDGVAEPSVPPEVHHPSPAPAVLGRAVAEPDDDRRVRSVTSMLGRLRTPEGPDRPSVPALPEWSFDRVLASSSASPTLDPEMTLPLDRGDAGEGRVGQVLEAARIHGLEVLHGLRISPALAPIDHLVVSANGVWVVHAVAVLEGRLERRDVGDWFNADPRLYVADVDRSSLVALVRSQVEAVSNVVVQSSFSDIPIRGVLSFGSVQPAWVHEPFVIDGISVTWRSRMVEPLLDPVLIGVQSRTALLHALAASVVPARSEGGGAIDHRAGVADPSEHVAG